MPTFRIRLRSDVTPVSVDAWRRAARHKLPDMAWSYVEGGADDLLRKVRLVELSDCPDAF